jgi:hypothetical protein
MIEQIDKILEELIGIFQKAQHDFISTDSLKEYIHTMAMYVIIESKAPDIQKEIETKLEGTTSPEEIGHFMLEYTTPEHYAHVYQKTALKFIDTYVSAMLPSLAENIQFELKMYLEKIRAMDK